MITSVLYKLAEEYYGSSVPAVSQSAVPMPLPTQYPGSTVDSIGLYAMPALYGAGMGAGASGLLAYHNEGKRINEALERAQGGFERTKKRTRNELHAARANKAKAAEDLKKYMTTHANHIDPNKQKALKKALQEANKNFDRVGTGVLNSMHAVRRNLAAAKAATPNIGRVAGWAGAGALGGALGTGALLWGMNRMNSHEWDQ